MIKKKRGLTLLETVLDIIIAVIVIIILFYVASAVFGIFFQGKEKAQGEGQIDNIIKAINAAKLSGEKFGFLLQNPAGWQLVSFINGENPEAEKSLLCGTSNCICICKTHTFGKPTCKDGICKVIDKPLYSNGLAVNIKIELKNLCIENSKDYYILTEEKCQLPTSLDSILAEKRSIDKVSSVLNFVKTTTLATEEKEKKAECSDKCADYAKIIVEDSERYAISDPLLVASIIIYESEFNKDYSYGKRFGLMGISEIQNWQDPAINIDKGTSLLKSSYDLMSEVSQDYLVCGEKYSDVWQRAVRHYRRDNCEDLNYVKSIMKIYEQLVQIAGKTANNIN